MENATKALLIAAAVLVAILIISLGLVVYNMASETIGAVNFSGHEIEAFNNQFKQYEGDKVRGSEVNALLDTVLSANMKSRAEGLTPTAGQKFVSVNAKKATSANATKMMGTLKITAKSLSGMEANSAKLYKVVINYDEKTGFVSSITVSDS